MGSEWRPLVVEGFVDLYLGVDWESSARAQRELSTLTLGLKASCTGRILEH